MKAEKLARIRSIARGEYRVATGWQGVAIISPKKQGVAPVTPATPKNVESGKRTAEPSAPNFASPKKEDVHAQLRGARAMLEWTSAELARRSKIHRRTIRKIERGEAQPQRKTLALIVAALAAGGVEFRDGGVRLDRG